MTPSQEAKEYAEKHGFTIVPEGRKYRVFQGQTLISTVSGYPAALHCMIVATPTQKAQSKRERRDELHIATASRLDHLLTHEYKFRTRADGEADWEYRDAYIATIKPWRVGHVRVGTFKEAVHAVRWVFPQYIGPIEYRP